ncbi:MAG: peptidylprolyl isomerase, partial [Deltaproteobacteria bacterium]|nr:peptidylprolyl isomerase [Deltaproteobacteria bacterium]
AAASCLTALGQPPPPVAIGPAAVPPVEIEPVIGKQVRWRLATTRGEIVIRLLPSVAPWAVATVVALTRKGSYDNLELHRVVPDFVVQGGDPTQSGWGGPGFTVPSEPATVADGAGFVVGGVGIADSGRDSGGSQWFAMHARAPHLDGRYTWIGHIESGQKSADALLIGDKVTQATVELADHF